MNNVDEAVTGLQFLNGMSGLELIGIFFIVALVVAGSLFVYLVKKGKIQIGKKKEDEREDDDPNVVYFKARRWEKDRVLKRHLGWIRDAYPKDATSKDKENLEACLRFAELESMKYTDYIIARNQFGKMSEREFDDYQEKIPMDIIMHVSRNITWMYDRMTFTVSRDKMLVETKKLIPKCVKDLAEMFMRFRMMEIENEKKEMKSRGME